MQASALISRANNASTNNFSNSSRKFWKLDWQTPVKPRSNATAVSDKPDNTDGNGEELYNFKFKTWLPADQAAWIDPSEDPDEIIDLSLYDRTKIVEQSPENSRSSVTPINGHKTANGLSADDIRGAVGGQETLSGFSATQTEENSKDTPKEPSQNELTEQTTQNEEAAIQGNEDQEQVNQGGRHQEQAAQDQETLKAAEPLSAPEVESTTDNGSTAQKTDAEGDIKLD
ncbi:LAME_0H00870g1_1 [Lachancea meyersii CBS 8951]|uniref:LAME_0H00870g1_1 n=1 Tax=Lachancea meyersii CBS 8951 TaxID=1266667 RepID=A0A1G4KD77_9SACH|nr:LAME_0H00870g1_1 [Lachancea meyersii CBS 8951]